MTDGWTLALTIAGGMRFLGMTPFVHPTGSDGVFTMTRVWSAGGRVTVQGTHAAPLEPEGHSSHSSSKHTSGW